MQTFTGALWAFKYLTEVTTTTALTRMRRDE